MQRVQLAAEDGRVSAFLQNVEGLSKLHDVTTQKPVPFIVTAVRNSNPTNTVTMWPCGSK
jgi:hypothetical protein